MTNDEFYFLNSSYFIVLIFLQDVEDSRQIRIGFAGSKPCGCRTAVTSPAKIGQQQAGIHIALTVENTVPDADSRHFSICFFKSNSHINERVREQRIYQKAIAGRNFIKLAEIRYRDVLIDPRILF